MVCNSILSMTFHNIFYLIYSVHKTKLYICFLRLNKQFIKVFNISNLSTNKMDVKKYLFNKTNKRINH